MPQLPDSALVNPSTDPVHYPGHVISTDSLLVGDWLYEMRPRQGYRLGDYGVAADGGPLVGGNPTLAEALKALGSTPIADRFPVVTVGSNACAGQLAHKFGEAWSSTMVPITAVHVTGLDVGCSAHINKAGYMPFAPVRDSLSSRNLVALWLDAAQLARVADTEPNYHPSTLWDDCSSAVLTSREPLTNFIIYRTRWGVYRQTPTSRSTEATSQAEVFGHLAELAWFVDLVPEISVGVSVAMAALAGDAQRRESVRAFFVTRGHRTDDGLPPVEYSPLTYGQGAGAKAWGVPGAWA
jgi:hypothetical protein